jgi:uncharacterized OB-fold protein
MVEKHPTGTAYYEYLNDEKLMGTRCQSCGALHLPPRAMCPECYGQEIAWVEMSGQGKVRAFTSVYIAPTAMIQAGYGRKKPYLVGIVELEEGPSISAQIVGVDPANPDSVNVGMPVRLAFVQRAQGGEEQSYLAFEPVPPNQTGDQS